MPYIEAIRAQEILDSRGQPTVLAEVLLDNGLRTQASTDIFFTVRSMFIPALLTSTSIRPKRVIVSSMSLAACAGSDTSA